MLVNAQQLKKIAHITRIDLNDKEIERLVPKLNSIIEEIKKLDEVNTEGVEPIAQITGIRNVLDHDEIRHSIVDPKELVKCSPLREGPYIKVPKAIESH